jgi:hypothetical protein
MPRTSSQPRPREGLLSLDDDALRSVLSFLSIADGRRGPGETSKALRQIVASNQLARARATAPYVLRGNTHGVVHALATAFGTRQWPTRTVRRGAGPPGTHGELAAAAPPARLGITIHREGEFAFDPDEPYYESYAASAIVDPDLTREICGGGECGLTMGTWLQYELPFQLQVTAFSFGFAGCGAQDLEEWTFEAFDGEGWRELEYCVHSPFPLNPGSSMTYPPVLFRLSGGPHSPRPSDCVSNRFRIRLLERNEEERCMHIRGLEIFGTVLPPWQV